MTGNLTGKLVPFQRWHAYVVARGKGCDPEHARRVAEHFQALAGRGRALTGLDLRRIPTPVYCFGVVVEAEEPGTGRLWSYHLDQPFQGHSGLMVLRQGRRALAQWEAELGLGRLVARFDPGEFNQANELYLRGLGFRPVKSRGPVTYVRETGGA